jgi:hypothetical protein
MNSTSWSRLQFGFTIAYHYLFPQLTMGLGLLILVLQVLALRGRARGPIYDRLARFWAKSGLLPPVSNSRLPGAAYPESARDPNEKQTSELSFPCAEGTVPR